MVGVLDRYIIHKSINHNIREVRSREGRNASVLDGWWVDGWCGWLGVQ